MGISRRGLCLGVAKNPPHHRQALPTHYSLRGESMTEVVDAQVLQRCSLAHPSPGLLQVRQVRVLLGSNNVLLSPRIGRRSAW